MRIFHTTIHARPNREYSVESRVFDDENVNILLLDPGELSVPLPVTFDTAAERLMALDRVFYEPDGSFVWVSSKGRDDWQLDGFLTDGRKRLMSIELKGVAPWPVLNRLLHCVDSSENGLLFQDMQRGLFLDQDAFRKFFCGDDDQI